MSNDRNRKYTNGTITVIWRPAECIHSGICFGSLRVVFNPIRRPWIDMEAAGTDEIIAVVERCPSDALTFFWNDDAKNRESKSPKLFDKSKQATYFNEATNQTDPVSLTYNPGTPLMVKGNICLTDPSGEVMELKSAAFCRCGQSVRQPFCDGSHVKTNFDK